MKGVQGAAAKTRSASLTGQVRNLDLTLDVMESHRKVLTGKLKRSRAHSQRPALMATYWRIPIIRHSGICKNYTGRKTSAETEEGADCRGGCSPRECRRLMVHLAYGDGYRTVCVVQLRELRTKKSEFYCV